jgi:nucleoside-diphosphate-sugar epimerase
MNEKQTIVITGAAGYVGEMLCDQFSKRDDVGLIVAIDKEEQSDFSKNLPKITYIKANLADGLWQGEVQGLKPNAIIHTAWQIRAMYGKAETEWRWNVEGSQAVFDFAFANPNVEKLIYFSTASSYSAQADNSIEHYFTEIEGFRADDYIYAHEKMVTEANLKKTFDEAKAKGANTPQVTVVRPAAITGPRGRYMRIRFGLQSALQGNLKGNPIYSLVTALTSFVPATKNWVRQFIHEDDVSDIISKLTFETHSWQYEVFNITPDSEPVFPSDMAEAVGKSILPISPQMARIAFFFFWHGTRGRVPTCPGSWRFYSYPVLMSGKKLKQIYDCQYPSKVAFRYTDGRYESYVPQALRRSKPTSQN